MKGKRIQYSWQKLISLSIFSFFLSISTSAHNSMFSIGVRGGGQTFLSSATDPSSSVHGAFGGAGTLDLRYTFYGYLTEQIGMGFALGAGAGYGTTALAGNRTDTYSNTDYLGKQMDYTIPSTFKQTAQFARAEATLMMAFCFGNVTVNIGPRFMMPFAAKSTLTITDVSIDAYYPEYYVHVVNKPISGYLATPYSQTVTSALPKYNVLMSAELGYEWCFDEKNCLGVQLYADVSVWNNYTANPPAATPLVVVAPITDAVNPVPEVTVNSSALTVNSMRYLDFGLRVYYAFSIKGSENNEHPNKRHHDTHNHRNRYLKW